jgi:hypothetical protein
MAASSIRERFWITIQLSGQQNAESSQRVAKRIRTVEFGRTRGGRHGFPKSLLPIHSLSAALQRFARAAGLSSPSTVRPFPTAICAEVNSDTTASRRSQRMDVGQAGLAV